MDTVDQKKQLLKLVKTNARGWYSATLGARTPHLDAVKQRIWEPEVGDLVLETSNFQIKDDSPINIGRLVSIEYWPCGTPEEFECAPEDVPTEKVWIIELCFDDNQRFAWKNASFITIPESKDFFR